MPRLLPLYKERPRTPVELEPPLACDSACTRCTLSSSRRQLENICVKPEGTAGGLLIVDGFVSKSSDALDRPLTTGAGGKLRQMVNKIWDGPIAVDTAIKCYTTPEGTSDAVVNACRTYLAATLESVKPTKVILLGQEAMRGFLGRSVNPLSVRKGYTWVQVDGKPVPVYLFPRLSSTMSNRFLTAWFKEDLEWALTTEPPFAPAWGGEARVVESLEDAQLADTDLRAADWFAYDVETSGYMWRAHQIVCASLSSPNCDYAWVWADKGLGNKAAKRVLTELLRDKDIGVVGSNVKYDELATMQDFGCRVRGVRGDTRLLRRLLDADADADLETMAELVGMGGHKDEAKKALVSACRAVATVARDNVSDQLALLPMTVRGVRSDVVKSIQPGDQTKTFAYGFMPRDTCITYNALDTVSTARLEVLLNRRREQDVPNLSRTYQHTVMPAACAVRQIEEWGALVDVSNIKAFQAYLQGEKHAIKAKLERFAGRPFNPDAYEEIRWLLFKRFGLQSLKQTEGGKESTVDAVLDDMRHMHPTVGLVCDWRKVSKLDGTYATGMLRHVRSDGRIHPSILLDGTRSGRPSCRNPNLQTIPRDSDSDTGTMARNMFVAPPGYVLAQLDYCLVGETPVVTVNGDVPIVDIKVGDKVLSCDLHGNLSFQPVTRWARIGIEPVFEVTLDDGSRLQCTGDHKWMKKGWFGKPACFVETRHLKPGDRMMHVRSGQSGKYPTWYARSNREYCYKHRLVAQAVLGEVPSGYDVDHVDCDVNNWCAKNLRHLPVYENRGTGAGTWWDGASDGERAARVAAIVQGQHKNRRTYVGEDNPNYGKRKGCSTTCPTCHTEFYAAPSRRQVFCSLDCRRPNNHRVVSVRPCGVVPVYHITVDNTHTFVVGNGMVSSNSQIELRVAAMLSGDPVMRELFMSGEDFHWATARLISQTAWKLPPHALEKKHRTAAKGVNFGLLYGQGDAALAAILGSSKEEAAVVRQGVLGQFKALDIWIKRQLAEARRTGYCWTYWAGAPARRRPLWKLADPDGYERSKSERGSWNTPIQGTASEYLVRTLTSVVDWILDEGIPAKVILPVHDSIMLEIDEGCVAKVLEHVHGIMTGWGSDEVPMLVDMEVGPAWGSLEKVRFACSDGSNRARLEPVPQQKESHG